MSTESRIETRREDGIAVISVIGHFDAEALRTETKKLIETGARQIDLDLSRVEGMDRGDSTALGSLVALVNSSQIQGAQVTLVNLPPKLRDILNIVALSDRLN